MILLAAAAAPPSGSALVWRILVGFGLAYALGFERGLRGSVVGDRTFALVGAASACIAAVTASTAPNALGGIVTGVGFIGGGVVFHSDRQSTVRGVTTAASIFGAAAVGLVVGTGHLLLGVLVTALVLLVLEIRFIPGLRVLDAGRYVGRVVRDPDSAHGDQP